MVEARPPRCARPACRAPNTSRPRSQSWSRARSPCILRSATRASRRSPAIQVHSVRAIQQAEPASRIHAGESPQVQQAQQVHLAQPVTRGAALVPSSFTWIRPASEIAEIDWLAMGDALDLALSDANREQ